jgi:serine/threonine protein kinase
LDRFELIAELASGGMATVYLARLSGVAGFQRLVAIKKLHPHLAKEPDFIQMFLDEARLAARLHHPHVVPILEIGEGDDGYFLVMEYIEGDTLARLLARSAQTGKRIPPKAAIRMVLDLLDGLHAAHELRDDEDKPLNIVHRDVSPQNVLCGVDGSVRLTDFGVARAASRLTTTRTGQLKGKLSYMAPEQARGKPIDRRADLFAAGIVLWESLAMRRLFKGSGEAETLDRVLYDPIPMLREANPEMPASIEEVVMKALERDVDKRHDTAASFSDALEAVARKEDLLGTHRDVAQHLELVLGRNISAHRDQMRSWLAHSEPSRPNAPRRDSRPPGSSGSLPETAGARETTLAENAPRSLRAVEASSESAGGAGGVDPRSVWSNPPSEAPPAPVDSLTPPPAMSSITGVSPADGAVASSVVTAARAPQPASRRWVWALSGAVVMLAVGVLAFRFGASHGTPPARDAAGSAPQVTTTESGETRAAASEKVPAPPPSESASAEVPSASADELKGHGARPTKPGHGTTKPGRPGASGAPTTSGPALPDDIEHNPYR